MSAPTLTQYEALFLRLDADPDRSGEKYVELHTRLIHLFRWKGCAESKADVLADDALDRVARKLNEGKNIENLAAYAAGVARLVWLEYLRRDREDATDALPELSVEPELDDPDPDERLICLRKCMDEVVERPVDRQLIIEYYDPEHAEKNKEKRKRLAESLSLTATALSVRACRLRSRLERCVSDCVGVTKTTENVTYRRGRKLR